MGSWIGEFDRVTDEIVQYLLDTEYIYGYQQTAITDTIIIITITNTNTILCSSVLLLVLLNGLRYVQRYGYLFTGRQSSIYQYIPSDNQNGIYQSAVATSLALDRGFAASVAI